MALSVVQAKKGTAATGTTVSVAVTVTATNLLVIKVSQFGGTNTAGSVTDNQGSPNTYTKIVATAATNSGNLIISYYAKNVAGGTYTITATGSGSPNGMVIIVHEVSGASTTAPFTSGEDATSSAASGTNPTTGSVTNSVANSIYFAGITNDDGANPVTFTPTSPFTTSDSTNSQELNGQTFPVINVSNNIFSASASHSTGWTTNNFSWADELDDFGQAAAAAAGPAFNEDLWGGRRLRTFQVGPDQNLTGMLYQATSQPSQTIFARVEDRGAALRYPRPPDPVNQGLLTVVSPVANFVVDRLLVLGRPASIKEDPAYNLGFIATQSLPVGQQAPEWSKPLRTLVRDVEQDLTATLYQAVSTVTQKLLSLMGLGQ